MAKSITLSEQGITYIGSHTTAGQARKGILFGNAEEQESEGVDSNSSRTTLVSSAPITEGVKTGVSKSRNLESSRTKWATPSASSFTFSDGCLKDVAKNNSVSKCVAKLHPSISPQAKRVYEWALIQIDYMGGYGG
jgi:hypothetical protein